MDCPDNYSVWEQYEAEQEKEENKLPLCEGCDEFIQDEFAFCIDGSWYCECCMNENFRKEVPVGI